MPRAPKLGKKNGHWYTRAGAPNGIYFGPVKEVSRATARQKFLAHLSTLASARKVQYRGITATELVERYLDWVEAQRSDRTYDERKRHLQRFVNFRRGDAILGELHAIQVNAEDLEQFKAGARKKFELDDWTLHKHVVSITAAFAWGAGKKNPSPCLSHDFQPFAQVEKYKQPPKPLLEGELPTKGEVDALLAHADDDLELVKEKGRFRSRRPEEYRVGEENPYAGFNNLIRVYWHTGTRTSELAKWLVRDFVRGSGQIVLATHKRTNTMKDAPVRRITLNGECVAIVERRCHGKQPDSPIFTDPKGRAWTRHTLDARFAQIRARAGVRDEITIYSFRHLWISEMLMNGADIATVAKMAGTSIAMVEKVYGHFTNDHCHEAQARLDRGRSKPVSGLIPSA